MCFDLKKGTVNFKTKATGVVRLIWNAPFIEYRLNH